MSTSTSAPVRAGELIAGKYRVERVLGRGGMGVVVAATHEHLGQRVAIKFLLPEALAQHETVQRFAREARAAAKIQSEHVARVLDVGTLETGAPFIVMEYLEGEDLAQVLRRRGPLPAPLAIEYVLQACEALAEAHAAGILHRDLKPSNLFLATRPNGDAVVKVLDFGISKALASDSGALTQTSAVLGSPFYMSPEQMTAARSIDLRSDIWSMGVVLYELVAGQRPFTADSLPELVVAILHGTPLPARRVRSDLSPALDVVLTRCLEKDPRRRFANIAQLAAALAPEGPPRCQQSVERISRVLGVAPGDDTPYRAVYGERSESPHQATWSHSQASGARPRRAGQLAMLLGGAAVLALVIGGGTNALRTKVHEAGKAELSRGSASVDLSLPPPALSASSELPAPGPVEPTVLDAGPPLRAAPPSAGGTPAAGSSVQATFVPRRVPPVASTTTAREDDPGEANRSKGTSEETPRGIPMGIK